MGRTTPTLLLFALTAWTRTISPLFYEQINRSVSWAPATHSPLHKMLHLVLFNDKLTPWSRVLEKLTGFQLVKKFPAFYGTRNFITAFTSARQLSLSWATAIQSIPPHPTSWRSILILSSHLRLGISSGLFPSGFPTKTPYTPLFSHIRATCPAHLKFNDKAIKNGWRWFING